MISLQKTDSCLLENNTKVLGNDEADIDNRMSRKYKEENIRSYMKKCLICDESHSHEGCANRKLKKPKCANCKGPHVASYKGCPEYKKQAFRQHLVNNQKSYAATVCQNTLPQPKTNQTFTFTAKQLTKFVANVIIQIAQPQVCYPDPKQDTLDLKSSMYPKNFKCRQNNSKC